MLGWIRKHPHWTLIIMWIGGFATYLSLIPFLVKTDNAGFLFIALGIYLVSVLIALLQRRML